MGYVVSAPLVYLRVPDAAGSLISQTFYKGAPVPENIDEASLQHHLDSGLVVDDSDEVAEVFAVPAGTPIPDEPPNVPVTEQTSVTVDPVTRLEQIKKAVSGSDGKPSKNAPKDEWVSYAQSQGAAPEEAEGKTKQELIDQYSES